MDEAEVEHFSEDDIIQFDNNEDHYVVDGDDDLNSHYIDLQEESDSKNAEENIHLFINEVNEEGRVSAYNMTTYFNLQP